MCHLVTRHNDIREIKTPADFMPGYRRKYMINTYGFDPDDTTNLDRWFEIWRVWNLPGRLDDGNGNLIPNPARIRYNGDSGYNQFLRDLEALKPRPVPW